MPKGKVKKGSKSYLTAVVFVVLSLIILALVVYNIQKEQITDVGAQGPACATVNRLVTITNREGWSKTFESGRLSKTIDLQSLEFTGTGYTEGKVTINGEPYIDQFSCGSTPTYGSDCSTSIDLPPSSKAVLTLPKLTEGRRLTIKFQIDQCTL